MVRNNFGPLYMRQGKTLETSVYVNRVNWHKKYKFLQIFLWDCSLADNNTGPPSYYIWGVFSSTLSFFHLIKNSSWQWSQRAVETAPWKEKAGGRTALGLNTSHLPPSHHPFWATDPQVRDSVQSILPHACPAGSVHSLKGHSPCVFTWLRTHLKSLCKHALTSVSVLFTVHHSGGVTPAVPLMGFLNVFETVARLAAGALGAKV